MDRTEIINGLQETALMGKNAGRINWERVNEDLRRKNKTDGGGGEKNLGSYTECRKILDRTNS